MTGKGILLDHDEHCPMSVQSRHYGVHHVCLCEELRLAEDRGRANAATAGSNQWHMWGLQDGIILAKSKAVSAVNRLPRIAMLDGILVLSEPSVIDAIERIDS